MADLNSQIDNIVNVEMDVGKIDIFNFAMYINGIRPVRNIRIQNFGAEDVSGLSLCISADFHFFADYEQPLPPLPAGKPVELGDPVLEIRASEIIRLTETTKTTVTVSLKRNGDVICEQKQEISVLAYDQSCGDCYNELLAAFVMPNHPVIASLMHEAAVILKNNGKDALLEGYQKNDSNRVMELAWAAYAAIQKLNIIYAEPPASFEKFVGQRIRTPEIIIRQRLGTCMDMTLLYASLTEAMGLFPVLYRIDGHIFCGIHLIEKTLENVVTEENEPILKKMTNGSEEIIFVECTDMCAGRNTDFEDAIYSKEHPRMQKDTFDAAIDVQKSRIQGIKPLPSRTVEGGELEIEFEEKDYQELSKPPEYKNIIISDVEVTVGKKITSKLELWESKLLDLSKHNMLLNVPLNKSTEPILSSGIEVIEDVLSTYQELSLLPLPEWISGLEGTVEDENGKEHRVRWISELLAATPVFEITDWQVADLNLGNKIHQGYSNHNLYSFRDPKSLDKALRGIYSDSKKSQQENGVSTLYLACGLLRWFEPEEKTPCYAPVLLIPVELVRKGANQGFTVRKRDEDTRINETLLEMLSQNFDTSIGGLNPLPADENGVDVKKVFAIMRTALMKVPNWDVVETCVLGNFSFSQFAMWNDIHTAEDKLGNSKIVHALMNGYVDFQSEYNPETDNTDIFLPVTLDETQIQAVKMAAAGESFVLHGPPGTGKSQTITAMIANLMAQGKKILFVAEKAAALNVVQKRLNSLGIGDFCLELHSDKANKRNVLEQFDRAISHTGRRKSSEFEEYLEKNNISKANLDNYAAHLHSKHNCGYSLYELIGMYQSVSFCEEYIPFKREVAVTFTKNSLKEHAPLIERLLASGSELTDLQTSPFRDIKLTDYSINLRSEIEHSIDRYEAALSALLDGVECLKTQEHFTYPETKKDYERLVSFIIPVLKIPESEPMVIPVLRNGSPKIKEYFALRDECDKYNSCPLKLWQPDFLNADISAYNARYAAAAKKLFGKASAKAAIDNEIMGFAVTEIKPENIPEMLNAIANYQNQKAATDNFYNSLSEEEKQLVAKLPTGNHFAALNKVAVTFKTKVEELFGTVDNTLKIADEMRAKGLLDSIPALYEKFLSEEKTFCDLIAYRLPENAPVTAARELAEYTRQNLRSLKDWALYNQLKQKCYEEGLKPVVDSYENGMNKDTVLNAYRKGLYYALIADIFDNDPVLGNFSGATFNEAVAQFRQMDEILLEQTKTEIFNRLVSNLPNVAADFYFNKELNILKRAITSGARGQSIRELFANIPHILHKLTPCMLMSPDSVAQYLPKENNLFDVVIFDEASQLQTNKAIGALYRAENAVIVGDPKQMPPTAFFMGAGPEVNYELADLDSILDDALALSIPSQYLQWHYRSNHESLIAFSNHQFYGNKMYTFPSSNDIERRVNSRFVEGVYNKGTNPKEAQAVVAEVVRRFNDPDEKTKSYGIVTFNEKQKKIIEDLLIKQYQDNPELDKWAHESPDEFLFVKNLENVQGDERDVILFSVCFGPDENGKIRQNFGPIIQDGGEKRLNVAFSRARDEMLVFTSMHSGDIRVDENSKQGLLAFHDFMKYAEGFDIISTETVTDEDAIAAAGVINSICDVIKDCGYEYNTSIGHSDFRIDIAVINPYEKTQYMLGIMLDGNTYNSTKNTRDREIAQIAVLKNHGWQIHRIWTVDWWDNSEREMKKLKDILASRDLVVKGQAEAAEFGRKEKAEQEDKLRLDNEMLMQKLEEQLEEVAEESDEQPTDGHQLTFFDKTDTDTNKEPVKTEEPTITVTDTAEPEIVEVDSAPDVTDDGENGPEENNNDVQLDKVADASSPAKTDIPTVQINKYYEYKQIPYTYFEEEHQLMSMADFLDKNSFPEIIELVGNILDAESPISLDALSRKVAAHFGLQKSRVAELTVKAAKKCKATSTKESDLTFWWNDKMLQTNYFIARSEIASASKRKGSEISKYEIKNAIVIALRENGPLIKPDLIKEASKVLGIERLSADMANNLERGFKFAKSLNLIDKDSDGTFILVQD